MISYSQISVFSVREVELLRRASAAVLRFPDAPGLRCHEVARAAGRVLGLTVQDGHYGLIEHSWLWTSGPEGFFGSGRYPNILDVYAVGSLPQVRLVDMGHFLPENRAYRFSRLGESREDVREDVVAELVRAAGTVRGADASLWVEW